MVPMVLFLLPLHWLEGFGTVCLIKNITGYECPGCGMSHAVISVIHGNFSDAFNYNKLVIVIFPLLSYIWLKKILFEYKKLSIET